MRVAAILALMLVVSATSPTTAADMLADGPSADTASASIEVPAGAAGPAVEVSIVRREAASLPPDTFPVPWAAPYLEVLPADASFGTTATVRTHLDLLSLGIIAFDPSEHGYPIAPMFTRDAAGGWAWLEDVSVRSVGDEGFEVSGGIHRGGPIFGVGGADLLVAAPASETAVVGGSYPIDGVIRVFPDSDAQIVGLEASTSDSRVATLAEQEAAGRAARAVFRCESPGSVDFTLTFSVTATRIGLVGELLGLGPVGVDVTHRGSFTCAPPCEADAEPNDDLDAATPIVGSFCVAGTLPSGDQDLLLWDLDASDTVGPQVITLVGVPGTQTLLEVFDVTSPIGAPVEVTGRPLLEASTRPSDTQPLEREILLRPGRYVAAVARSGLPDGGEPEVITYGLRIEPAAAVGPVADVEPNDDAETANAVAGAFSTSGDRSGDRDDWFTWTVSESGRWDLTLDGVAGETAWLELRDEDGDIISSATEQTSASLYDLMLETGRYRIRAHEAGDGPHPYVLRARPSAADGDPEPNDTTPTAVTLVEGVPVRGRLAVRGDRDRYVLTVPAGDEDLRDVRLLWRSDDERRLCLLDPEDAPIACQQGRGGASLPALDLAPGAHTLDVSGQPDPDEPYVIRLDRVGPAEASFEREPNDELEGATLFDLTARMRARAGDDDIDHYRLSPTGDAQLWDIELVGDGIERAELVRPDRTVVATGHVAPDGSHASLDDIYLVPGDHWLRVRAAGPEYSVTTTALGPPDPAAEREPNDSEGFAERYRIGERRSGRLPTASDVDLWRFTLSAPQPLRIIVAPPADGAVAARVVSGNHVLTEVEGRSVGEPLRLDLWLEPGDHVLELRPTTASDGDYELTSERLDPFDPAVDREPNDDLASAVAAPAARVWTGDALGPDDRDVYRLPEAASGASLRIDVDGDADVRLEHRPDGERFAARVGLDRLDDRTYAAPDSPAGGVLFLTIEPRGPYTVTLDGAITATLERPDPPLTIALTSDVVEVAAYWPDEQVVDAVLELVNGGTDDLVVDLEAATSDRLWRLSTGETSVTVAAGTSLDVPASISVAADAWADEPVRISLQASVEGMSPQTAALELVASRDAPPVASRSGWPIPDAILGGLDVASSALGAEPAGTIDAERERLLFDGVTPSGGGFSVFLPDHVEMLPLELGVDLAGDAAVPVVGTIINPQAGDGDLDAMPRDFELWLSEDGQTWEAVLSGTLSPQPVEQAFVLDAPYPARHARLMIESTQVPGSVLTFGEWKIVARPGWAPSDEPPDLAEPALGGHIVDLRPFDRDPGTAASILDPDPERVEVGLTEGRDVSLVVGFRDGRAAQVTTLEWQDPTGSRPDERLDEVLVFASRSGPAGPWSFLGRWVFERDASGEVAPLSLQAPTWMRYLRLSGEAPFGADMIELPARLAVRERPIDADYRSILGEWGHRSRRGPLEWLEPTTTPAWDSVADAADTRAEAAQLAPGIEIRDRVAFGWDEDWYGIDVPATDNTLEITIAADPLTGVRPRLLDDTGAQVPLEARITPDDAVRYEAQVSPGARYDLHLDQPPFSAVFAFDTSPSLHPFRDIVAAGLRSFFADIQPGREAVTLLPFEEPPLHEGWQDDAFVLQDALDKHVIEGNGSSGAEVGLIDGARLLADREGARAIILLTDAQTSTLERTPDLWEALAGIRPVIFSVHVGGVEEPVASLQRMQDWAAAGGGRYVYPDTFGEMGRSFDRMATWLRRPASYALTSRTLEILPARLAVAPPANVGDGDLPETALAADVGIEIVLDTSASMRRKLGKKRRIEVAKAALRGLLRNEIAEGVPVAIRTFGAPGTGPTARCGTTLSLPLRPLDRDRALDGVGRLDAKKGTGTPIAAALERVAEDLAEVDGLRRVVLITDGEESCDGDPMAAVEALVESGIDARVDIIGFALKDEAVKAEMAAWATAGGGVFLEAGNAKALSTTIRDALRAPFQVFGEDGALVATGTVGADGLLLEPGLYRVEVLTDPPTAFDRVALGSDDDVTLTIDVPD